MAIPHVTALILEERITLRQVSVILRQACASDTSFDPLGWSIDMPWWGHCAAVSLIIQDYFDGTIMRQSLEHVPGFEKFRSHYSNRLPSSEDVDLTIGQLRNLLPTDTPKEERTRQQMLHNLDMLRRYETLKGRFERKLAQTLIW
ncbi:hypothetical protein FJY93_01155 [Candidatus Kaiserbacteria bacterium]|nr:hypothetical protein [Candidatus Kaiserbacteria bacterium]